LLYSQPDLAEKIAVLTEADLGIIANAISDALQDVYHLAIELAVAQHLALKHNETR
jgi:hypothetical protein